MPNVPSKAVGLTTGVEGVWGFWGTAIAGHSFAHDSRVLYVDPGYTSATDLGNTGEDPLVPFATVEAALARCRDYHNDTILVGMNNAWKYSGAVVTNPVQEEITVDVAGVRIIGCATGYGVPWEPVTAAGAGTCITITAMDVHIEGFAFQGALVGGRAIYAVWDGATLLGENCVIRNCVFDEAIDVGIQFEFSWNNLVESCIFFENATCAIYVDPAGSGASSLHIRNNHFHDCALAMALNGVDDSLIEGNFIYNANAQGAGLATDEGIDTTAGAANIVCNNYFSCLLPVPANGDIDDLCSGAASDAWVGNHCQDGLLVTTPT